MPGSNDTAPPDQAGAALLEQECTEVQRPARELDQHQVDLAGAGLAAQPEPGAQSARELDMQLLDQLDSLGRARELDQQALHEAGIIGTPQAAGEQRPYQLVYCLPLAGGQRRAQLRLPQPLRGIDINALEHLFRAVMSVEKLKAEIESTPEGDPHAI